MCDTEDGEFVIYDHWDDSHLSFPDAEACFTYMKNAFQELRLFQIGKETMHSLRDGDEFEKDVRKLARKLGWPSADFRWQEFHQVAKKEIKDTKTWLGMSEDSE